MKVILRNSSMSFQTLNEDAFFANAWNEFDQTKFNAFITALGGKNGTIWGKIKLLYMPIFSTAVDGNIYLDVKSKSIIGLQPADALTIWERTSDESDSSLKGYKAITTSASSSIKIDITSYNLTTDNVCAFGLSLHNPNPSSSLTDVILKTDAEVSTSIFFKNTTSAYKLVENSTPDILSVNKVNSGFGNVIGFCSSNVNGVLGVALTDGSHYELSSQKYNPVLGVTSLSPAGRDFRNTNIYGEMFSICGVASGLTPTEAATVCTALNVFLS